MAGEFEIKVKDPARPSDALIEIHPFGLVENGSSFTAILTASEAERYGNNGNLEVTPTKRKKSEMSDDDKLAWDQAVALEKEATATAEAEDAIEESAPVAGDESIEATEPVEGGDN